jgi:hypothetical protein
LALGPDPAQAGVGASAHAHATGAQVEQLVRFVAWLLAALHEVHLFGGVEFLELRQGAAEPDLARRVVDKVDGDKPAGIMPVLRFDHEMGDRTSGWVNDNAAHLTADSIGAANVGPDHERRLCHGHSPRLVEPVLITFMSVVCL